MAVLEVLYFDDKISERTQFEPIWQDILKQIWDNIDIRYDPDLTNLASKLHTRPHIVIVDNLIEEVDHNGKREVFNNEGAQFIAEHKRAHPDTIFVLHTGRDFSILQLGQRHPNPDLIVTKDYLRVQNYKDYLAVELQTRLKRLPIDVVESNSSSEATQRSIVKSLVEQVAYDLLPSAEEKRWSTARLAKLSGSGFSGASVYRLELSGGSAGPSVPTVLKLGKAEQIEREIAAFQRYAKWYLPHDMRVDIVGRGTVEDQSALCYAFALGSHDKVEPMAEALRRGKKSAGGVIKQLFQSTRQGWYIVADGPEPPIKSYFSNLQEYPSTKDEWRDICFEKTLTALCENEGLRVTKNEARLHFSGFEVDEIRRAFGRLPDVQVPMCICHGDLNANNIFHVKDRPAIALIDFEQTGLHHVFRDFVSFECSIRSLFQPVKAAVIPLVQLVDLELALLNDVDVNVSVSPVLEEVQKVRKSAFVRFPTASQAVYTAALALHLWKLLGFRDNGKSQWHASGERHLASGLVATLTSF